MIAERSVAADDVERKVTLLLEHGVRADRSAAEKLTGDLRMQRLNLADLQHRIELLRMYGCQLQKVNVILFRSGLATTLLPLLAYLRKHGCEPALQVQAVQATTVRMPQALRPSCAVVGGIVPYR